MFFTQIALSLPFCLFHSVKYFRTLMIRMAYMKGQNCIIKMRDIKIAPKRFVLRRGKSKLCVCIAYLNRYYCCPDSHPQYLFVLWKKSPFSACGGPQDALSILWVSGWVWGIRHGHAQHGPGASQGPAGSVPPSQPGEAIRGQRGSPGH